MVAGALCLSVMAPRVGLSQDARGSTLAVNLLNRASSQIATANAVEYSSTVRTVDALNHPITLYVHAKLRRPLSARLTISTTAIDASDAVVLVMNPQTITGYDPQQQRSAQIATPATGLTVPFGFTAVEPALPTARECFSTTPFVTLLPSNDRNPLLLDRRNHDVLNAQLILSQMITSLMGQVKTAKLWVDATNTTPRRLILGDVMNGTERVSYVEDFATFTLNPTLPDDTFNYTPPGPAQAVTQAPPTPVLPDPPPPAVKPAPKKSAPRKGHSAKRRGH